MLLAALLPIAIADGGPEWGWYEGLDRQYYIESTVLFPFPWMIGEWGAQTQVRTQKTRLRILTTCAPMGLSGPTVELACSLDQVALVGASVEGEDPKDLEAVLLHYDEVLEQAWVQLKVGRDGTVRALDLEGVDKSNRFLTDAHEWCRLMLWRAFAGLDFELPPENALSWVQHQTPLIATPYGESGPGKVRVNHSVGRDDFQLEVSSEGSGIMTLGEARSAYTDIDPLMTSYAVRLWSETTYDYGETAVVERSWGAIAEPTASMAMFSRASYLQGGYLRLITDGAAPDVGPSGTWSDFWEPGPSELALDSVPEQDELGYDELAWRSDPYLWLAVAPTWTVLHKRGGSPGLMAMAGVRLPLAFNVAVGASREQIAELSGSQLPVGQQSLFAGIWYEPTLRVAPRVGGVLGMTQRTYPELEIAPTTHSWGAIDMGVMFRTGPKFSVGVHGRAPVEFRRQQLDVGEDDLLFDPTSLQLALSLSYRVNGRSGSDPE